MLGEVLLVAGIWEVARPGTLGRAVRVIGEGIAEAAREAAAAKKLEADKAADLSFDPMGDALTARPPAWASKGRVVRTGPRETDMRKRKLKSIAGRAVERQKLLLLAPTPAPLEESLKKKTTGGRKKSKLGLALDTYRTEHPEVTVDEAAEATLYVSHQKYTPTEAMKKAHRKKVYDNFRSKGWL